MKTKFGVLFGALLCFSLIAAAASTSSDTNWVSMGPIPGVNGAVYAAVVDSSGNLYIGGNFTAVGDIAANHIAKWNGSNWVALGSGMDSGINALAISGNDVYAAGSFMTAGGVAASRIAKWDGTSWTALGPGLNSYVLALAASGNEVYAGGSFTMAGSLTVNHIAKWDGSGWSALGSAFNQYDTVFALAASGSNLYAGGSFTSAGGIAATNIAKWNGSTWTALGPGLPTVTILAVLGSDLYAGAGYVAKWNGSTWSALGSVGGGDPYNGPGVSALVVSGSNVYVGGVFTTAGGVAANYIAKWDGSNWSALGSGMGGGDTFNSIVVRALVVSGSDLYAAGVFKTAGGSGASGVARWDGSSWNALGSGMSGSTTRYASVCALAASGSNLYAGGFFSIAGGSGANYAAKWNGARWSPLGSSLNGPVTALAASGGELYAGGAFTTADAVGATNIAKWNGSSWTALGSGVNGLVRALAISGSNVYVGGDFTSAGGSTANYVAKWNGTNWSVLGSGIGLPVYGYPIVAALAVSGPDLYVGGSFGMAGGGSVNNIAKWNGSSWSALGSGLDYAVYALTVSGSNLYVGGSFGMAGGGSVNNIARWNGSSWSALDIGMNGSVRALAASGTDLYVGGYFSTAGGIAANRIAQWNGNNWSALGSGLNDLVSALAVSGNDVYAGGYFSTAGGKISAYAAKWAPLAFVSSSVTVSNGAFHALLTGPDTNSVIVDSTATFTEWTAVATNMLPPGGAWQVSIPTGTNVSQFYRARFGP